MRYGSSQSLGLALQSNVARVTGAPSSEPVPLGARRTYCRRPPAYLPGRPARPRPDWRRPMAVRYQLVINCVGHPESLARFWAEALGYVLEPPPAGFVAWDDWRRDVGLPESWIGRGTDCIVDPD